MQLRNKYIYKPALTIEEHDIESFIETFKQIIQKVDNE